MDSALNFEQVRKLIPQSYPFLMVDRVLEVEPRKRVVAVKNVTGNEGFFQGHFPNLAVMPAALVLEALAQAAIVLTRVQATPAEDYVYLFGSVRAKMERPVFPGDVLRLEVKLVKALGEGGAVEGVASVEGRTCVTAELFYTRTRVDELLRR